MTSKSALHHTTVLLKLPALVSTLDLLGVQPPPLHSHEINHLCNLYL